MNRRDLVTRAGAAGLSLTAAAPAHATLWLFGLGSSSAPQPSAVVLWNRVLLQAIAATSGTPTVSARTIAMVHEAIYNAWAHYDSRAAFTVPSLYKRPLLERNATARTVAISHAAHGVLTEFFPGLVASLFEPLLQRLVANAWTSIGGWYAGNVGRDVAWRVINARNNDGANMRGDLAPGAYSDWTGYQPINSPDHIVDLSRWVPLRVPNSAGDLVVQRFLTPHWGRVRPFALSSGAQFRPTLNPVMPLQEEIDTVIRLSAELTDQTKGLGNFFAQNPGAETPPGQWMGFAEQLSTQDGNGLDADVKLFFAAAQAGLDASIAAWDAKRAFDQGRPASVIPVLYRGQVIRAWGGPGRGTQNILGETWVPWQRPANKSPPFPDFVSGHSTFSAAMATAMASIRASDRCVLTGVEKAGSFRTDPGLPLQDVNFRFTSLSGAADAAGFSRQVTGIHWNRSDLRGRELGKQVGGVVANRCVRLYAGYSR